MIRVLILAPYASVRAGLRVLLSSSHEIEVIGEARDAEALGYLLASDRPDAVIYDASAGDLGSALDLLAEGQLPIVSLCEDADDVELLVRSRERAWAALPRSAGGDEIAGALHAAAAGIVALDPEYVRYSRPEILAPLPRAVEELALTPREREVLQLMTHGLPNKNIANRLQISLSTAKFHVASILSKLAASSRTEAVTIGARRGLVSL